MTAEPDDRAYGAALRALMATYPGGVLRLSSWVDIEGGEHWCATHEVGRRVGRQTRHTRRLGDGATLLDAMRALLDKAVR